jgi:DTW domain-containing protein YfiP
MTPRRFPAHAVDQLRHYCQQNSTRKFNARGVDVKRCPACMLGHYTCICDYRRPQANPVDVVLIMHRDEVYKPTNSGRLIADLFPAHTRAFLWDRINPDTALLDILNDPNRQCGVVFPPDPQRPRDLVDSCIRTTDKKLTLIILDGTWKQARKMFAQAKWLQTTPLLDLAPLMANLKSSSIHQFPLGHYPLRKAAANGHLSTAEATALALASCKADLQAVALLEYFSRFTEHYVAMKMNRRLNHSPA